jgi:spermidine/putrescine transport system ATP-binding protein
LPKTELEITPEQYHKEPYFDVSLEGVTKRFAEVVAVDNVSLNVQKGEFLCILGPSGCGKTTTMTRMVFQNYALFPHMTVFDNIAYGLRMMRVPKNEIQDRVEEVLSLVKLDGFEKRKPHQLSGGQQQRVALARAIVPRPTVLLLDEPLGALDLKLRKQMQIELKVIQLEVGITFIYVTHDQDESLTMADRIAVMKDGHIEQIGTPVDIYENPANAYVCDFVGIINMYKGIINEISDKDVLIRLDAGVELRLQDGKNYRQGQEIIIGVRPEKIVLSSTKQSQYPTCIPCHITNVNYQGTHTGYIVEMDSGEKINIMVQNISSNEYLKLNERIFVHWTNESIKLFPQ